MKYRFEIVHCPEPLQEVVSKMKNLEYDLTGLGIEETIVLSSEQDFPVDIVKSHIISAYTSVGSKVLFIEGGTIE